MIEILKMQSRPKREVSCPLPTSRGGVRMQVADHTHTPTYIPSFSVSKEIDRMVRSIAPRYRLDPNLVFAVIEAESSFNPKALSSGNAQGLMQLIPATAKRFGVKNVWDPEQNLKGGMAYLRWLLDHYEGNVELALAGYNAGERAVERYQGIPPVRGDPEIRQAHHQTPRHQTPRPWRLSHRSAMPRLGCQRFRRIKPGELSSPALFDVA